MLAKEIASVRDLERYFCQQGVSKRKALIAASVAWREIEPETCNTKALTAYVLAEVLKAFPTDR